MLIDTHTHLYDSAFDSDGGGAQAVRRALEAGVGHMVFPNVDRASIAPLQALADEFPDNISVAMGIHPTEVKPGEWEDDLRVIEGLFRDNPGRYVGVGEVGMDLYWDAAFEKEQMQAFDRQLSLAGKYGMPVIIHCRQALPQTLEVLAGHPGTKVDFHSFGGTVADVETIRRVAPDAMFGINGILTFKNSGLRDVLPAIGLGSMLLETDSPYLAPVPCRGKRNESAFLPYIAAEAARALGTSPEEVASATTANARTFFGI